MSEAVKAALITGGVALLGIIVSSFLQMLSTQRKIREEFAKQTAEIQRQSEINDLKLEAKLENSQAVTNEKIDELTKRVEKHNNVIERTYKLEQETAILTEKAKRTDARLEDLEHMGTH